VVAYGEPLRFLWQDDPVPDSLLVALTRVERNAADTATLWFDAGGNAIHNLEPGAYEWSIVGGSASGIIVVEEYSDELPPRAVYTGGGSQTMGTQLVERYARENWWLFVIVIVALAGEWGWRYRKGLP
jgi:hypothetical protein